MRRGSIGRRGGHGDLINMKSINKDILKLAIPSILANITVPLVGMVDIAVAGHLDTNAATMIGGIAIGSMLFDLLYWNFGFLRVGTGGLAAQAYGRGDRRECARILSRALGMSLAIALLLIAIQWIFVKAAFLVVDCSPQVRELASEYFFVRIWAAPATLSLMALKGWFIGMQDSVSAMVADVTVNGMNILMSFVLALGLTIGGHEIIRGMGFTGIAAGTVVAQWTGLAISLLIIAFKYRRDTMSQLTAVDIKELFRGGETKRFFVMNANLFVRSLCFIAIYIGFTVISARYGDTLLAVFSIMMKLPYRQVYRCKRCLGIAPDSEMDFCLEHGACCDVHGDISFRGRTYAAHDDLGSDCRGCFAGLPSVAASDAGRGLCGLHLGWYLYRCHGVASVEGFNDLGGGCLCRCVVCRNLCARAIM